MSDERGYVLVTGGTGFIGAHVVGELLGDLPARPWGEVKALTRSEEGAAKLRALGAEPLLGDLFEPGPGVQAALAGARYVVHCAQPEPARYGLRSQMDERLLEALDPAHLERVVYVGGSSYFGTADGGGLMDETSRATPVGVGPTFEPGMRALRARGVDYAAALVGGVYGRGSWHLEMLLRALEKGEPIPVLDPAPRWPYIHIDDCARAISFLLTVDRARLDAIGREIIVVDDEPVRMDEFIAELASALGKTPTLRRLDERGLRAILPSMLVTYWTADMPHSNARLRALGFACRYPHVREGLRAIGLGAPAGG